MKKLNYIFAGLAFLSVISFSACSSDESEVENDTDTTITQLEEKMDKLESAETDSLSAQEGNSELGKEYTSEYICPDHCKGSGSDHEGECSNCGMDLMENPTFEKK